MANDWVDRWANRVSDASEGSEGPYRPYYHLSRSLLGDEVDGVYLSPQFGAVSWNRRQLTASEEGPDKAGCSSIRPETTLIWQPHYLVLRISKVRLGETLASLTL